MRRTDRPRATDLPPPLWFSYVWPLSGLLAVALLNRLLLINLWPHGTADLVTLMVLLVLAAAYGHTYLSAVSRQHQEVVSLLQESEAKRVQLMALQQAMTVMALDREADGLLLRVVEVARGLTRARYGALAVLNPDETIARFLTSGLTPEEVARIGHPPTGRGLLGEVIRHRKPLRVDVIARHPAAVGWPTAHPVMTTFLGIPILLGDEVVGHLYLTDKAGGPFDANDEELVGLLAAEAAVLITNARLNQRLEQLAVLEERQRIGMDLHDGTIQSLYALTLSLDALIPTVPENAEPVRQALDDLAERIVGIIRDIRHYIFGLHQEERQWRPAVEGLLATFGLAETGEVEAGDGGFGRLAPPDQDAVLAFVHEALSNVARHAAATRVVVRWALLDADHFAVEIQDNGQGFDPDAPVNPGHYGLQHLERRATSLGGTCAIESRPGEGTIVRMEAPLRRQAG